MLWRFDREGFEEFSFREIGLIRMLNFNGIDDGLYVLLGKGLFEAGLRHQPDWHKWDRRFHMSLSLKRLIKL